MYRSIEKWLQVPRKMVGVVRVGRKGVVSRELKVMEMDFGQTFRVPTMDAEFGLSVMGGGSCVVYW